MLRSDSTREFGKCKSSQQVQQGQANSSMDEQLQDVPIPGP